VLPPVNVCTSNPGAAGCPVVSPPSQSQQGAALAQALNTTINLINVSTKAGGTSQAGGSPAAASSTPDDSGKKNEGKEEGVLAQIAGTKDAAKKTYCN